MLSTYAVFRRALVLPLLVLCALPAAAEEPIDVLAETLGAKVYRDDDATVTGFRVRFPGRGDARRFQAEDVAILAQYPDLTYLMLNNPVINLPELKTIGTWTQLEHLVLWLGGGVPDIPSEFVLHLGDLQNLRTLDMKHTFSVKGDPHIQDMATFPKLEKLVVDTVHSNAEMIPFVERHPGIRWLRIHRTGMSDADFGKVVDALPNLEILELKPGNQKEGTVGPAGLAHLKRLEHLRSLTLSHEWDQATWEGGIKHLVDVPSLELVSISVAKSDEGIALLERLSQARPDVGVWGANRFFLDGKEIVDDAGRDKYNEIKKAIESDYPREMTD